jgi:hypothetical protein
MGVGTGKQGQQLTFGLVLMWCVTPPVSVTPDNAVSSFKFRSVDARLTHLRY